LKCSIAKSKKALVFTSGYKLSPNSVHDVVSGLKKSEDVQVPEPRIAGPYWSCSSQIKKVAHKVVNASEQPLTFGLRVGDVVLGEGVEPLVQEYYS
jgi:hypothetical protein